MSNAALLPTAGDPFLLQYWLLLYKRFWKNNIDGLYVYVNNSVPDNVIEAIGEMLEKADAKQVLWANIMIDHGKCLEELLELVDEDNVMLVEDDGFIFKSGKVDAAFARLNNSAYQVVASKRGSCSPSILEMAQEKWGLNYQGYGDQGCNFWPCFFFTKTSLLKGIGGHFGASAWPAGEMIEGLEMRTELFANGDTFVSASLRIREALDKIRPAESPNGRLLGDTLIWYEPQYHGDTDDMPDHDRGEGIWSPDCYWTHSGSLSTGVMNLLNLERELPKGIASTEQEKLELERRVMYWIIFWENADTQGLETFHDDYAKAITRLITHYELNEGRINQRKRAYYEIFPKITDRVFNGS